jgi:ribosomal protein S4
MIRLRENVLLRKKILKFKRLKWNTYLFHLNRKLTKVYLKYKIKNIRGHSVSARPNKWEGFEGKHRNILYTYKRFRLFYGVLSKKSAKRIVRSIKKRSSTQNPVKLLFYKTMERRLDTVLYRAKFSYTIKSAKQLIKHGNVLVNGNIITNPTFPLHSGDLVKLAIKKHTIRGMVQRMEDGIWPHPPSNLYINYKTLEILLGEITFESMSTCFHFQVKPNNMVLDFFYH